MKFRKQKNYKTGQNLIYKIISVILIIVSAVFIGILFFIDLLPTKYLSIILCAVLSFDILSILLINIKKLKKKLKKSLSIFIIIATIVMSFASFYMAKTLSILATNGDSKYKLENYAVIVLKDSSYKQLKDIKNEKVGYFENSIGTEESKKRLASDVNVEFASYNSSNEMVADLLNSKINVILLEDSIKSILEEEVDGFKESVKIIYTFKVKIKSESMLKEVDVTKEPFVVYISGIDTYGEISSVSRSDVNIVMVVNPKTHQILLISIPRDYYVQLHGTTGTKDKLTHAGIYGIDMSIHTIEDLLNLEINYYLKVNFTSVIDIVDALGGLDVYSEYSFISYSDFRFKRGMNYVNGEQALDFARTRKAFVDGDRQRGKNQQAVIEALIRKATNKSIITKYNSLLNAINGKYQTNMSMKKITSIIKMQLDSMPKWTVTSHSLTGYDSSNYTYTYNQLLYVMEPDEESIGEAIHLIDKILNDETLENSYNNVTGDSSKVTKVDTNNVNGNGSKTSTSKPEKKDTTTENVKENDNSEEKETKKQEITNNETDNDSGEALENSQNNEENPLDPILPQPSSNDNLGNE